MKTTIKNIPALLCIGLLMFCSFPVISQDQEKKPERPVRNMFESNLLIDNQTVIVPIKGTFEFDILHRFGTWDNGYDDFWGMHAPSNIRLGFSYVPINNLQLGFGLTKQNLLWDFNVKYAIIEQTRSGKIPLSLSYYGNMAIDSRDSENFEITGDRFSYFHQLMIARKISDRLSVQGAFNVSHFNAVKAFLDPNDEIIAEQENDHLSYSFSSRYKFTDVSSILLNIDQPITNHEVIDPVGNISFGVEFVTSSHAFQIFVGNYKSIVPQYNNVFNSNSFGDNEVLIGFNMTRLWNF